MHIKVAITDDHPMAINGLQYMLSIDQNILVIDTYETGTALLEGLPYRQPDILLLDIELPDYKGYELAEIIQNIYPSIRIIAITSHDAPILIKRMLHKGCTGYALKNIRAKELVYAIRVVYEGKQYLEPTLQKQITDNINQYKQPTERIPILTQREKEILNLIVQEHTNHEIAKELYISLRTIENHRSSLMQKLNVKNAIGLVRVAIQLGLLNE